MLCEGVTEEEDRGQRRAEEPPTGYSEGLSEMHNRTCEAKEKGKTQ